MLNNGSLYLDPTAGSLLLAISFNRAFNLDLAGRLNACLLATVILIQVPELSGTNAYFFLE